MGKEGQGRLRGCQLLGCPGLSSDQVPVPQKEADP